MKKLFFFLIVLTIPSFAFSQSNNWSTIESKYSAGPISPEFQYNYSIVINKDRTGMLIFTKGGKTDEYNFKISNKGKKMLNNALFTSRVFSVSTDNMKAGSNLIGGPEKSINITMWQAADLDQKPTVIVVPGMVNAEYENGIENLYTTIEKLVPNSVWKKAGF
ncbi:MAG: hypothetical protein ABI462_05615 [Ignavibacteria bacterium]